jgi:hypothetical protein
MSASHASRLTHHHPLRILLPVLILAWFTATALLASQRGAERRMHFDGAGQH